MTGDVTVRQGGEAYQHIFKCTIQHLLVSALGRLTETSVRVSEVYLARRDLEEFVSGVHTLYGMNCVTFNQFGNLWTHSAFLYERYNGLLKNSVRSSNGTVNQIVMEFQTRAAVQFMESDLNNILSTEEKQYISNLNSSHSKPNITKDLGFVQVFWKGWNNAFLKT
ncbi:Homologous-pairing protein 2, partial [Frankliniella fusca]